MRFENVLVGLILVGGVACGNTDGDGAGAAGSGNAAGAGGTAGAAGAAGTGAAAGTSGSAGSGGTPATGDTLWAARGDGAASVFAVSAGADGRVIAVGAFSGSIDFGAGALTSAGDNDLFVVSYDVDGHCVWSRGFGGVGNDGANAVAIAENGDVIVSGSFSNTMDVNGKLLASAGSYDVPLITLDAAGNVLQAERYGGPSSDIAFGLDARSGVIALTGASYGPIDFGAGPLSGIESSFVFARTTAGAHVFSRIFDELSIESVALDATGHVAIGGSFNDPIDLGTGPIEPVASTDGFVARLSPEGTTLLAHRIGDGSSVDGYAVAVSPSSDIVFGGMANAQGEPISSVLLERVSAKGEVVWGKKLGSANYAAANSVAIDADDNVVIAGLVRDGTLDLGCGPHASPADPASKYAGDVFVAKLDASGSCLWSKVFGGAGMQFASDVAVNAAGRISVGGYFQQTLDFGSGPLEATHPSEPFVATFSP